MVEKYPTYIISTRPIEMVLGGIYHEFYLDILIFLGSHQNDSQKPFFIMDTGNVLVPGWQSSIIITVAFWVGCFPFENVTSSDETQHIWNNFYCKTYISGNFLFQTLSTTWDTFLLNLNPQYDWDTFLLNLNTFLLNLNPQYDFTLSWKTNINSVALIFLTHHLDVFNRVLIGSCKDQRLASPIKYLTYLQYHHKSISYESLQINFTQHWGQSLIHGGRG